MTFKKTERSWQHTRFILNWFGNLWEYKHRTFCFLYVKFCDLQWRSWSFKLSSLVMSTFTLSLKETDLWMSEYKPTLKFFWWNHKNWILSLEDWLDKIKWEWDSSNQQVSTCVKFHPNPLKTFRYNRCRNVWFLASLWPWVKVKVT